MALADNVVITKLRHWCQKSLLTSHKHFRLETIQVSYNSIVCNSVEHVEFCAWKFADDLRTALIFCFHLKKTAAESHRMLVEAYGEHALGKSQCFEWFKKFRCGNFDARNEERGRPPKKFQDSELQALLDEDDAQTQQQLADQLNVTREVVFIRLKAMGKI